jgi:anti-sigma B factor antagonist
MHLDIELIDDVPVITINTANLDVANIEEFREEITRLLEPHSNAVIDLSELDFMDSSGLGALLSCMRRLRARGGDLKLAGMNSEVKTLFALVHMERIMDVFESSANAVSRFSERLVKR